MNRLILSLLAMMAITPVFGQTTGTEAWATIYQTFSHPRCANCHVADGVPMWTGPEYVHPGRHGMHVGGDPDSQMGAPGLMCDTCHGLSNAPVPHGPPGADYWLLPPASLAWFGKSSGQVCAQTRDPALTGGYTAAQLADRLAGNPMVVWAWSPGEGREPAPGTIAALADALRAWDAAGTPCPAN